MALQDMLDAGLLNPSAGLLELDRLKCEDSLSEFTRGAWKYIDPAKLKWNWHLDAIAEHLQAVAWGNIRRLIINVPPRSSKSSMTSVAFPAWVWAQRDILPLSGPQVQFLTCSYAGSLATRDSLKSRRLIGTPWYQDRWGDRVVITKDQDAKWRYDTTAGGYRLTTSVDSAVTGEGGNIIIIDDAHNAKEAQSKVSREGVIEWWDGSMSSRLNNANTDAYIVIMQRLHEDDLTGHILSQSGEDWTHLCLPMEYESGRHCVTVIGMDEFDEPVTWEDPRVIDGQLLCPSRFDKDAVEKLKRALGPYNASGQLQQRPVPKGGNIFPMEDWREWGDPDNEESIHFKKYPPFDFIIASLDTAYGEKQENDFSACTVWGVFTGRSHPILPSIADRMGARKQDEPIGERWATHMDQPMVMLAWAWAERLPFPQLVDKVVDTCRRFKVDRLLIEAKASGMSVAQEMQTIQGSERWGVQLINPGNIDKVARAYSIQHLFRQGLIWAPHPGNQWRDWAELVIVNMSVFPKGQHDDLTDSAVQGLRWLRDCGFVLMKDEMGEAIEASVAYRGASEPPLYPGAR